MSPSMRKGQGPEMKDRVFNIGLGLLTAALVWLAFPPVEFGAAAWVAFVPLLILIGRARPREAGLDALLAGGVAFILLIHWMRHVTVAGWIGLALYCALYWPAAALLLGWLRRRRIPFLLSAPLVLTTLDFIRANLFTGFPFFFIGHTQYRYLPIIQIADLAGAYGVTFLVALVNGCIADAILERAWLKPRALARAGVTAAVLLGALGYGFARLRALDLRPGPTVGLVQGNVPQDLKCDPSLDRAIEVLQRHVRLTEEAAAGQPDLIVWPETMFPAPMNDAYDAAFIQRLLASPKADYQEYGRFLSRCRAELEKAAAAARTHLLVGAETNEGGRAGRFNSAYLISPAGRPLSRYDKIHLVIFGEYVPFGDTVPLLRMFRPAAMGPDLFPGRLRELFDLTLKDGREVKFGVTICYEDTDAELFRQFAHDGAQFMVNTTNDGWFRNSTELDEHLAVCAFRAVESRVPIARCANTGISALITPDGRIARRIAQPDGRCREVEGTLTGALSLTPLESFYAAHGNAFAWVCAAGVIALIVVAAARGRQAGAPPPASHRR